MREEITLKRFQAKSVNGTKGMTVHCKSGSVWVTAGEGFGDIVLEAGQEIAILSADKLVVEALSDCSMTIESCVSEGEEYKQALEV